MTKYKYSAKIEGEHARAVGRDISVSTKHSVEICRTLRGMNLNKAKQFLGEVIKLRSAVPYKRYLQDLGHKKGIGPGRYPVKAATQILKLIQSVEANAQSKGLNTGQLALIHICAHQASRPFRSGRQRGRLMKRSHVEIIAKEVATTKKSSSPQKTKKESSKNTPARSPQSSTPAAPLKKEEKHADEKPKEEPKKEALTPKPAEKKTESKPETPASKESQPKEINKKPLETKNLSGLKNQGGLSK